ncbi:PrgI family protein [Candidatus Pacebacteria bacterium]|nr:PrgI family protein [Candidatus Paceibacterota bacterium]
MRFEVPQFIEIEDKIFGPFTWKQFVYLIGGVGFAIVLFLTTNLFVFILVGVPIGGLAVLLAFYKINNRPFSSFLESMMQYFGHSKLYLWKKTGSGIYHGQPGVEAAQETMAGYAPEGTQGNLNSLSRKLELKAIEKQT